MPRGGHNRKSIAAHLRDGTFRPDRHGPRPGDPESPESAATRRLADPADRNHLLFSLEHGPLLEPSLADDLPLLRAMYAALGGESGLRSALTGAAGCTLPRTWRPWVERRLAGEIEELEGREP